HSDPIAAARWALRELWGWEMPSFDELRRLSRMREGGHISEASFARERDALLETIPEAETSEPVAPTRSASRNDVIPLLGLGFLSAIVLACLSMLIFNASFFTAGVIGVVTLGLFTLKLHSDTESEP
ncbi:MAG: hypothetical protein AAFQ66_01980, partial [Pseudomonadota bacterium]